MWPSGQESVRLQKYLSRAGVASRREGERLISQGRVSIDGVVVTELGTRVVPGQQVVSVDGERIDLKSLRWTALYKPAGYITTRQDDRGRPTVYALLAGGQGDLFHVGRLDRLTEGLLLLTNDGELAHRLLHPRYEIPRRYRVEVWGAAGAAEAHRLRQGVVLEDGVASAEDVRISSGASAPGGKVSCDIYLTLREGRKREVRRLMEALNLKVRRLVRVSFGPIGLGSLQPGESRALSADEVKALRAAVGLRDKDGDT